MGCCLGVFCVPPCLSKFGSMIALKSPIIIVLNLSLWIFVFLMYSKTVLSVLSSLGAVYNWMILIVIPLKNILISIIYGLILITLPTCLAHSLFTIIATPDPLTFLSLFDQ